MKTYRGLERSHCFWGAVMLFTVLGSNAALAQPAQCEMQLTVELWPDVPNPSDPEFLSSLLNNHVGYRLTLQQQRSSTVVVLDLTGPGRCQDVVETMRKDARVLSVHSDRRRT